jgi:carbonic anhydrase/acetyltransferase-like protein (isoleucine patch superfamily)
MSVHPDAYVAASAILAGEVSIGAGSCALSGAILTADGGPIVVGSNCVIMEHAVIRGTRRHPATVGDHVLIRPHAYLSGANVADEVFIATGAMIFNGARLERASSVALGGALHIGARLTSEQRLPIGWVAVGDPARMHNATAVDEIRAGLTEQGGFLPYVFGVPDTGQRGPMMRAAQQRYTAALPAASDNSY